MSDLFNHPILTVRIHAGFNANVFLAGLLALTGQTAGTAQAYMARRFPEVDAIIEFCLLYTSPSPRDLSTSRMPSSA